MVHEAKRVLAFLGERGYNRREEKFGFYDHAGPQI